MAPKTDLQTAIDCMVAKRAEQTLYYEYADGMQPLVYSSTKLREIFHKLDARFIKNICAVVVDSVTDRLILDQLVVDGNEDMTAQLQAVRESSGLLDDEVQIHEDIAITGEAFVIIWPSQDQPDQVVLPDGTPADISTMGGPENVIIEAFRNDPRMCHVEYEFSNPRRPRFAAKWWEEDEYLRMTLYYRDHLENYTTRGKVVNDILPDDKAFIPWSDENMAPIVENPFGIIPVFHFRGSRRRPASQLQNVIPLQDTINKLIADMMVAAEFGAYPQRYVISQAGIQNLQNAPNTIWDLVASDQGSQPTSAGQFDAADLDNYLKSIDAFTNDVGVITRTPKHFFYVQGGDPSGEALIAMEAPLNKKVTKIQTALQPTWRDVASFLLQLIGLNRGTAKLWAQYQRPETVQPKTEAEIRKLDKETGIPLKSILRNSGYSTEDLALIEQDMEEEQKKQADYAAATLEQAQRNFDRGQAA